MREDAVTVGTDPFGVRNEGHDWEQEDYDSDPHILATQGECFTFSLAVLKL